MSKRSAQTARLILLCAACTALPAPAQTPAPPLTVTVVVTNAIAEPPQPVQAAHVSLTHLINSLQAVDAQGPTNPRGEAQLVISQSAAKNGDLRIVISGAGNLVIYEPADGQLSGLKSPVRVALVPAGSLALMGPAQIQAYLRRMLLEVNSLQKQVSAQKNEAAQGPGQEQYLTSALADFAQATGFSRDQVNQQVAIWAQNIKLQAAQATAEQKALAAFALRDYAAAAEDYNRAADATQEQMNGHEATAAAHETARENEVDAARDDLRQLINQRQSAAGADQLRLKYHDATETLESAVATADAEYKKHPDDKGFHELWLQAVRAVANARRREGAVAPADQSLPLLAQSAADFDSLARDYAALGDREDAAAAQYGIGIALTEEGERAGEDKAAALLDQAVQSYRRALEVRTKTALPQAWAATQDGLGDALAEEGKRAAGDKAATLLDQAVQAYRNALEVYTRADLPKNWANAQNGLGNGLTAEGERAGGDKAAVLLDQAVQAYRSALQVYTKADLPHDWALTQSNLGIALQDEGERARGDQSAALFDQSVQAFRSALEVYTKADVPQDWANTQNSLGVTLWDEGTRTNGDRAMVLLGQAVQAYRSALEVYTKADLPQDWAMTQNNLGNALKDEGERTSGDQAAALLHQAVQAYRSALTVLTRADRPRDWALTQSNLVIALADEGDYSGAAEADKLALEVLPNRLDLVEYLSHLDHEILFRFEEAYELDEHRTQIDPSAGTRMDFVEASLTSDHFATCIEQAAAIQDSNLSVSGLLIRDTIKLACQWGAGQKADAQGTQQALLVESEHLSRTGWLFTGSLHYLATSPAFANGRASWIALFTAVQNGDAAGITGALHQLEPILQQ